MNTPIKELKGAGIMNLNRIDDEKNVKDIINKNNEEIKQENERLKGLITDLTTRIETLEAWKATGASATGHYVSSDTTWTSNAIVVTNGLITTI